MAGFLDALRVNKGLYVLALSAITTIVLINETFNFAEKVLASKMLSIFSLLVFVLLFNIAVKEKLWVRS